MLQCGKNGLDSFSFGKSALSRLRKQIISKEFVELEDKKDHLMAQLDDPTEPSNETRSKFTGYGILAGRGSAQNDKKHLKLFKKISADMDRGSFDTFKEYYNFLIHDGIAINHPQRDTYPEKIRHLIKGASQEWTVVSTEDANEQKSDVKIAGLLSAGTEKPFPQDTTIEDAEIVEETKNPPPSKKEAVTTTEPPHSEDASNKNNSISSNNNSYFGGSPSNLEPSVSDKNKKIETAAQVATLGGAALLTGLTLSHIKNSKEEQSKEQPTSTPDKQKISSPSKNHASIKPLLFITASAITVGGAIAWSKKPKFVYEPLKELLEKLIGGGGRGK